LRRGLRPWSYSLERGLGAKRRSDGRLPCALLVEQLARLDRRGHILGLLPVHGAVLELDDWVLGLPTQALDLTALAAAPGPERSGSRCLVCREPSARASTGDLKL